MTITGIFGIAKTDPSDLDFPFWNMSWMSS